MSSSPKPITTHITLDQLLEQARGINPDVQFVTHERICGNYHKQDEFTAHTNKEAFTGDTPDELLADILAQATQDVDWSRSDLAKQIIQASRARSTAEVA